MPSAKPMHARVTAAFSALLLVAGWTSCENPIAEQMDGARVDQSASIEERSSSPLHQDPFQLPRLTEEESPASVGVAASFMQPGTSVVHRVCLLNGLSVVDTGPGSIGVGSLSENDRELLLFARDRALPSTFGAVSSNDCQILKVTSRAAREERLLERYPNAGDFPHAGWAVTQSRPYMWPG